MYSSGVYLLINTQYVFVFNPLLIHIEMLDLLVLNDRVQRIKVQYTCTKLFFAVAKYDKHLKPGQFIKCLKTKCNVYGLARLRFSAANTLSMEVRNNRLSNI